MIVIGILVLMIGVGVAGFDRLSGARLRTETSKLAAAVRHTFNRASAHGLYMRMVFDLDGEAYWVEASDQPMFLTAGKRTEADEEKPEDEDQGGKDDAKARRRKIRARYQEDGVIPRVKLEGGVGIDGVLTSGQKDVFRTGRAYLHFFPNGFVEPALIHTTDGEGTYFTLTIHPLTGKVTRQMGRADPGPEFGQPHKVEQEGR